MAMILTAESLVQVKQEARKIAEREIQFATTDLRAQLEALERRLVTLETAGNQEIGPPRILQQTAVKSGIGSPRTVEQVTGETGSGTDGCKSSQYIVLTDEEEAALGQESQRPESLFCYCAFELAAMAHTEGPLRNCRRAQIMVMIIILVAVEFLLATALFESSWMPLEKALWSPPGSQGPSNTCFYQQSPTWPGVSVPFPVLFGSKVLFGKPRVEWVVAAFSYLVVLLTVKADDRQLLLSAYPTGLGLVYQTAFFLMWTLRTFYRSAWIISATVVMIAGSGDIEGIIMNSVAATFLLEIDDLAYSTVLSEAAQKRYQESAVSTEQHRTCAPARVDFFSWFFFGLNWVAGSALYIAVNLAMARPGAFQVSSFIKFPVCIMVCRSCAFMLASECDSDLAVGVKLVLRVLAKAAFGFLAAVAMGLIPWMWFGFNGDPTPDKSKLEACLAETDMDACFC
mmetsp:Transcript_89533/g.252280  ORF Transcript_89533/g.252280 Transcript_89533/m.252280 type:complete len:456 (+) Transcript_89533:89-1456(+)